MEYLKKTDYRLLAFDDENKNGEFDFGKEAAIDTIISFENKFTKFSYFDLNLVITDTTSPFLEKAKSIDNTHVQIKFSEPMSEQILQLENYSITDTLNNTLKIFALMEAEGNKQSVILHTGIQNDNLYIIIADSTIADLAGNILGNNNKQTFIAKSYADTIPPKIINYQPKNNALLHEIYPVIFSIKFDEFMDKKSCEKAFSLAESIHDKKVKGKFEWQDETQMEFHLEEVLEWITQYTARLDTTAADAAGNRLNEKLEWKVLTVPQK